MTAIEWLREWFKSNCDGLWEHTYGITISTIDNPGWSIDIDLEETPLENKNFDQIHNYVEENNWLHCSVVEGVFRGRGSIDKLEEILEVFRRWAS